MKQPVRIEISDIGQVRADADNPIVLKVVDPESKMPFLKVQLQRKELNAILDRKLRNGHLGQPQIIDGFIIT